MTIANITVVRCDLKGCERTFETGWPVTDETARAYATRAGWWSQGDTDFCPTHARTISSDARRRTAEERKR